MYGFLRFAEEFMNALKDVRGIERVIREIKWEMPKIGVFEERVIDRIKQRSSSARLKAAQRRSLKKLDELIEAKLERDREIRKTLGLELDRAEDIYELLPAFTVFQLPTGSGKTLLYGLIAFYSYLMHKLRRGGEGLKFVFATRTNFNEGVQVLETLFALKAALMLVAERGKLYLYDLSGQARKVSKDDVKEAIIGFFWGSDNYPCLAEALLTEYRYANVFKSVCYIHRRNKKCPYRSFEEAFEGVIHGEHPSVREILFEISQKGVCPLIWSVLTSLFGNFVVTNHATLKLVFKPGESRPPLGAAAVTNSTSMKDYIEDIVRFLFPRKLGTLDEKRKEEFFARFEEHVPERTVIVIDEADNFLQQIAFGASKTFKVRLPLSYRKKPPEPPTDLISTLVSDEDPLILKDVLDSTKDALRKYINTRRILRSGIEKRGSKGSLEDLALLVDAQLSSEAQRLVRRNYFEDVLKLLAVRYILANISLKSIGVEEQGKKKQNVVAAVIRDPKTIHELLSFLLFPANIDDVPPSRLVTLVSKILDSLTEYKDLEQRDEIVRIIRDKYRGYTRESLETRSLMNAPSILTILRLNRSGRSIYASIEFHELLNPVELLERMKASAKVMMFSATYDYLLLLIYFSLLYGLEDGIQLAGKEPVDVQLIIDTEGRERKPNELVIFANTVTVSKNTALSVLSETLQRPEIAKALKRLKREGVKGLVLTPAKNEVREVVKVLKGESLTKDFSIIPLDKLEKDPDRDEATEVEKAFQKVLNLVENAIEEGKDANEIEKILAEEFRHTYEAYIKPTIEERLKVLVESGVEYDPKVRLLMIRNLLTHVRKNVQRLLLLDVLSKKFRKETGNFVAIATGAFARGLDMPGLNYVLVLRANYLPEDIAQREASEIIYAQKLARSVDVIEVLERLGFKYERRGKERSPEHVLRYHTISNAINRTIQAMGRLTRGRGFNVGIINDGRFLQDLKPINELYTKIARDSFGADVRDGVYSYVKRYIREYSVK